MGEKSITHKVIESKHLDGAIKEVKKQKLEQQGLKPLDLLLDTPCQQTKTNYKAFMSCVDGISVKQSCIKKMEQ